MDSQVISTETLTDDDIVNKIRGEIEDEDGVETDKGGEEIDASADTQENTRNFSTRCVKRDYNVTNFLYAKN